MSNNSPVLSYHFERDAKPPINMTEKRSILIKEHITKEMI